MDIICHRKEQPNVRFWDIAELHIAKLPAAKRTLLNGSNWHEAVLGVTQ